MRGLVDRIDRLKYFCSSEKWIYFLLNRSKVFLIENERKYFKVMYLGFDSNRKPFAAKKLT